MKALKVDAVIERGKFLAQRVRQANANLAYIKALTPLLRPPKNEIDATKCLYFVRCGDAIKIGISSDPVVRIQTLQVGAPGPLSLIAVIPNAGHREGECHRRFSHLHIHGEWFRYVEEVDLLIQELSCPKE